MQCIVKYASGNIRSYLKSVLRYKFLVLHTYDPDILYLRQKGWCHGPWLFSKPQAKNLEKTGQAGTVATLRVGQPSKRG